VKEILSLIHGCFDVALDSISGIPQEDNGCERNHYALKSPVCSGLIFNNLKIFSSLFKRIGKKPNVARMHSRALVLYPGICSDPTKRRVPFGTTYGLGFVIYRSTILLVVFSYLSAPPPAFVYSYLRIASSILKCSRRKRPSQLLILSAAPSKHTQIHICSGRSSTIQSRCKSGESVV